MFLRFYVCVLFFYFRENKMFLVLYILFELKVIRCEFRGFYFVFWKYLGFRYRGRIMIVVFFFVFTFVLSWMQEAVQNVLVIRLMWELGLCGQDFGGVFYLYMVFVGQSAYGYRCCQFIIVSIGYCVQLQLRGFLFLFMFLGGIRCRIWYVFRGRVGRVVGDQFF